METKYIVTKDGRFALFNKLTGRQHSEVAYEMVDDLGEIVSAGFCDYYNGKIECWGYSVTCNVGARPEKDAMLIQEAIEAGKVSIIHGFDGLPEIATNEPFGDTVGFAELLKYKVL